MDEQSSQWTHRQDASAELYVATQPERNCLAEVNILLSAHHV